MKGIHNQLILVWIINESINELILNNKTSKESINIGFKFGVNQGNIRNQINKHSGTH